MDIPGISEQQKEICKLIGIDLDTCGEIDEHYFDDFRDGSESRNTDTRFHKDYFNSINTDWKLEYAIKLCPNLLYEMIDYLYLNYKEAYIENKRNEYIMNIPWIKFEEFIDYEVQNSKHAKSVESIISDYRNFHNTLKEMINARQVYNFRSFKSLSSPINSPSWIKRFYQENCDELIENYRKAKQIASKMRVIIRKYFNTDLLYKLNFIFNNSIRECINIAYEKSDIELIKIIIKIINCYNNSQEIIDCIKKDIYKNISRKYLNYYSSSINDDHAYNGSLSDIFGRDIFGRDYTEKHVHYDINYNWICNFINNVAYMYNEYSYGKKEHNNTTICIAISYNHFMIVVPKYRIEIQSKLTKYTDVNEIRQELYEVTKLIKKLKKKEEPIMSRYTKDQIKNANINDNSYMMYLEIIFDSDDDSVQMEFDSVEELLNAFQNNKEYLERISKTKDRIKEELNELVDSKLESDDTMYDAMSIIIDFVDSEICNVNSGIYKYVIEEDPEFFCDNTGMLTESFIPDKWLEQFVPELADGTQFSDWSEEKQRKAYLGALDFIRKQYNIN